MDALHAWVAGIGSTVALAGGIWAVGKYLPGIIVTKVHGLFNAAKVSPWWRNPAHPKRARWLLATAELLEDEIPEPGQGKELYAQWGAATAALSPLLIGTAGKWAGAYEKCGDAVDTGLDVEIKTLAAELAAPCVPAPVVPPAGPPAA